MKADKKKRLGLWIDKVEYELLAKECREYNRKNGLSMTVNKYILKVLRERHVFSCQDKQQGSGPVKIVFMCNQTNKIIKWIEREYKEVRIKTKEDSENTQPQS